VFKRLEGCRGTVLIVVFVGCRFEFYGCVEFGDVAVAGCGEGYALWTDEEDTNF